MSETKPKFTPGPWEWWTSNSWRRLGHSDHGHTDWVLIPFVNRYDYHPDCEVSEADMSLIASAPDLYEALAAIMEDPRCRGIDPEHRRMAYAALSKARGEKE